MIADCHKKIFADISQNALTEEISIGSNLPYKRNPKINYIDIYFKDGLIHGECILDEKYVNAYVDQFIFSWAYDYEGDSEKIDKCNICNEIILKEDDLKLLENSYALAGRAGVKSSLVELGFVLMPMKK